MAFSEGARAELYTGLAEVLGSDRAETLMAQLPGYDPIDAAIKADVAELRTEVRDGLAAVNQRLDRIFVTLLVGMFGLMAAMAGVILSIR